MKRKTLSEKQCGGRRRFLAVLAALTTGLAVRPVGARLRETILISLREADFYRPHDLAG